MSAGNRMYERPVIGSVPEVALIFLSLFAAIVMSGLFLVLGMAITKSPADDVSLGLLAFSQVGLWSGFIGGPYFAYRQAFVLNAQRAIGTFREFVGLHFRPVDALWAFLGPVLQLIISSAYRPFVSSEDLGAPAKALADRANGQVVPFVLLALATAIGAPIVEELFFRGFAQRALLRTKHRLVSKPAVAVGLTALLFGAFHFQPLQALALAFFGAVAGTLAYKFGRIGPAVWLHIGFNTAAMIELARITF